MNGSASVRFDKVVKRHGSFTALHGIDLEIAAGEFFALLGPSGSGKTTTLRILAGLESVDEGRVHIDGVDVTDTEPGERDVAMVFQSYALYPHMTVAQNIGFPLKMVRMPADRIAAAVADAAAKVGIGHLLDRRPGQLSGGQQQRCALARAIVRQPRLFLLDEPLSNLDAKLRLETRAELRKLQRSLGVTAVYVTHDQEEAMTIADRVAVFMEGRIVQVGTPLAIFRRPANAAVAGFIGTPPMNLLEGRLLAGTVQVAGATLPVAPSVTPSDAQPDKMSATSAREAAADAGPGTAPPVSPAPAARDVILGVRAGDLRVEPGGIPATVEFIEHLGDSLVVNFDVAGQRIKLRTESVGHGAVDHTGALALTEGQRVGLGFAPGAAHLFDRASGERIGA